MAEPSVVKIWYDKPEQRTKGLAYRARADCGLKRLPNGQTRRLRHVATTYTRPDTPERATFEKDFMDEVLRLRRTKPADNKVHTIGDLCNWLAANPPPTWAEGHHQNMRSINRRHIQPYPIAARPYARAIAPWFHEHINNLPGLSKQTKNHVAQYFQAAYTAAALKVDAGGEPWWDKINPLTAVKVHTGADPIERTVPTKTEAAFLLHYMRTGHDWDLLRAGIAMAWTGMRPQEWCALEWADIDWDTSAIEITTAVKAKTRRRGKTKSRRGKRLTFMPTVTRAVMTEWRAHIGSDRFVFPHVARNGYDYSNHAIPNWFTKAMDRAKKEGKPLASLSPELTLYGIRHRQISVLTENMSPAEAASVAGHTPSMSIDHYTHALSNGSKAIEYWDAADNKAGKFTGDQ